jgi:hypothetical protein
MTNPEFPFEKEFDQYWAEVDRSTPVEYPLVPDADPLEEGRKSEILPHQIEDPVERAISFKQRNLNLAVDYARRLQRYPNTDSTDLFATDSFGSILESINSPWEMSESVRQAMNEVYQLSGVDLDSGIESIKPMSNGHGVNRFNRYSTPHGFDFVERRMYGSSDMDPRTFMGMTVKVEKTPSHR